MLETKIRSDSDFLSRDIDILQSRQGLVDFNRATRAVKAGQQSFAVAGVLLSQLTHAERLFLLDGDEPFYQGLKKILCDRYNRKPFVHGEVSRLGIPGIRFSDGPRGVVMGESTAFPVPMARGATWDTELETRIGHAIGLEARAQGANHFAGICINLPRHPAWGRVQETYGEDPLLLGQFGTALVEGVRQHVMPCVKHFALNSMENARFRVNVKVDQDVLHEVYLPHFRKVIEAGVASVMSAYNSVNGEWAGQSRALLTDILRNQWNFDGFVISDFIFGLRDPALSVKHGLDIEAPFSQQRKLCLEKALLSGELAWSDINAACLRILSKQLDYASKIGGAKPDLSVVFCEKHRDLAREAAARAMVLLKNDLDGTPLLPLDPEAISSLAIIGRLANVANTGDKGSSQVFAPHVVTPLEGFRTALPHAEVLCEDSDLVERAEKVGAQVDVAICVVGYDASDEGEYVVPSLKDNPTLATLLPQALTQEDEKTLRVLKGGNDHAAQLTGLEVGAGGDRASLRLRPQDVKIIEAVMATNPRTIVAVVAAGAVVMEEWRHKVPALLMSWYSGTEGGHALADVVLGKVDASGRLPFSIPKDETHLPHFDRDAEEIRYDRWFGQYLLDKLNINAAYPLGFGLSYTSFAISNVSVDRGSDAETLMIRASVTNTGERKGRCILQIYGLTREPDRPRRRLLGFAPVDLRPGDRSKASIKASLRPLQRWVRGNFVLESRVIGIEVASHSGDNEAVSITYVLHS